MYNKINEKPLKKVRFVDENFIIYEKDETSLKEDVDDYIFKDEQSTRSER